MGYKKFVLKATILTFILLCLSFLAVLITILVTIVFENDTLYYIQDRMFELVVFFGLIWVCFLMLYMIYVAYELLIEN